MLPLDARRGRSVSPLVEACFRAPLWHLPTTVWMHARSVVESVESGLPWMHESKDTSASLEMT